jgi:outer membrane receptor protein involved in Fe transport
MQSISDLFNIEAGFQGRYRNSHEDNEVYYFDLVTNQYDFRPEFSNNVQYLRNIHAAYALSSGEWKGIGYQLGLRAEYTLREIKLNNTGENFDIDRIDFFPTTHISYQLNDKNQFMASYSRRIDRPRGWFMEPFITWDDAFNVRSGNPNLKPQYINAYELGYQLKFYEHALSAELYYRKKSNNIERIRRPWSEAENVTYTTFENVGNDHSLGTEIMLNLKLAKWWDADVTGNFYDYRVEGELDGENFDKHSFTYSVSWNNTFTPFDNTRIQFNPAYEGPEIEPQEEEKGYFRVDGAIRQSFLQKKLQFTLQVRDIFATAKWESTTKTATLYNYRLRDYRSPIVMLNVTWRINNYKSNKGDGAMMNGNGGGMGEE